MKMKQAFKVVFRYSEETESFMKWAEKYCLFMRGLDKRGRGYGLTEAQQKVLKKELEAKFGSVEMARQHLTKTRVITIYTYDIRRRDDVCAEIEVGRDTMTFEMAIQRAKELTRNWATGQVYHVGLANSYSAAERMAAGREARIEKIYLSNVFAIDVK